MAAIIGNNVYIGPKLIIVDDIQIGDDVTIGTSAVVIKSLPNNTIEVGNPARIVSINSNGKLNIFKRSV